MLSPKLAIPILSFCFLDEKGARFINNSPGLSDRDKESGAVCLYSEPETVAEGREAKTAQALWVVVGGGSKWHQKANKKHCFCGRAGGGEHNTGQTL